MMSKQLLILIVCVGAVLANDLAAFKRLVNRSRVECRRSGPSNAAVRAQCLPPPDPRTGRTPARVVTTGELLAEIPGGLTTVRQYSAGRARGDLHKTAELCEERESEDGAKSWKNIERTARVEMRLTKRDELYSECLNQMEREKQDCADMKNLLCAFKNHQAFECAPESQRDRTAGTIDNVDQCYSIAFFNYGRPKDLREFRTRQRASKANCRRDTDLIEGRCGRRDESLQQIMASLPTERSYSFERDVKAARTPEIESALSDCLILEQYGYGKMRAKMNQVYRGKPAERRACMASLREDHTDRCRQLKDIMCAYSYGTDLTCKSAQQTLLQDDACRDLITEIRVEMAG